MGAVRTHRAPPCHHYRLMVPPTGNRTGRHLGRTRVFPVRLRGRPAPACVQNGPVRHWDATQH
eukprot:3136230-Lingulodinium_polyedra.AAC.1